MEQHTHHCHISSPNMNQLLQPGRGDSDNWEKIGYYVDLDFFNSQYQFGKLFEIKN